MNRSNEIFKEEERNLDYYPTLVFLSDENVYEMGGIMTTKDWEDEREFRYKISKSNFKPINDNELLTVFPEGKKFIEKDLKILHQQYLNLNDYENKIKTICYRKISNIIEREETEAFFLELEINIPRTKIENKIKRLENMLKWSDKSTPISTLDIPKAKSFPISDLIKFRNNTACCIWHTERTPSMHYYDKSNRVKCFGCGKSGDSIDVVMQLRNCTLAEAVNFINKSV